MNKEVRKCEGCGEVRMLAWFSKDHPEFCAICLANDPNIVVKKVEKKEAEVVEDKSCAGGACTL